MSIEQLAAEREALHAEHESSRPLSEGYERVGLRGEEEFSRLTGLPLDTEPRPGGDGGRDFRVPSMRAFTVDVKTARKPYNLIVEQGKVDADVYVLARYADADNSVEFLGWAYASEVLRCAVRDFGHGVMNHYRPAGELHKMPRLLEEIARRTRRA